MASSFSSELAICETTDDDETPTHAGLTINDFESNNGPQSMLNRSADYMTDSEQPATISQKMSMSMFESSQESSFPPVFLNNDEIDCNDTESQDSARTSRLNSSDYNL